MIQFHRNQWIKLCFYTVISKAPPPKTLRSSSDIIGWKWLLLADIRKLYFTILFTILSLTGLSLSPSVKRRKPHQTNTWNGFTVLPFGHTADQSPSSPQSQLPHCDKLLTSFQSLCTLCVRKPTAFSLLLVEPSEMIVWAERIKED